MNIEPGTRNSGRRRPDASKGEDIADRLLDLAARVLEVATGLPDNAIGKLARQLLRAGRSGGANYEETRCAESRGDFIHKVAVATKEVRESLYWLRIVKRMKLSSNRELQEHIDQADQIISCRILIVTIAR